MEEKENLDKPARLTIVPDCTICQVRYKKTNSGTVTLSRNVSWHDIQRWKQENSSHQTNGESDAEACLSESSADRRKPSRNCLEPQRRLFHPSNRFSACLGWTRCGLSITCQHMSQQVDIGVYVRSLKLGMLYMTSSFPLLHPKVTF